MNGSVKFGASGGDPGSGSASSSWTGIGGARGPGLVVWPPSADSKPSQERRAPQQPTHMSGSVRYGWQMTTYKGGPCLGTVLFGLIDGPINLPDTDWSPDLVVDPL